MTGFFSSVRHERTAHGAESRLRELYGDVRLDGLGGYAERSVGDPRFAVSQVELEGRFDVEAQVDVVTVATSTPGYRWRAGNQDGDLAAQPAIFQPSEPMASRLDGRPVVTTVTFDVDALHHLASAVYGSETPIRFDGSPPVSAATGRVWIDAVRAVDAAGLLEHDLARAGAFRSLGIITLEAFRLSGGRRERVISARAGLDAYRRASQYIDDHLSLPITDADVARHAGISLTELGEVFAAHSPAGWSPREQLRRARLAAAHLDLVNADPTLGATVSGIAARWGFTSGSDFARRYRGVYGVTPRWVLHR